MPSAKISVPLGELVLSLLLTANTLDAPIAAALAESAAGAEGLDAEGLDMGALYGACAISARLSGRVMRASGRGSFSVSRKSGKLSSGNNLGATAVGGG